MRYQSRNSSSSTGESIAKRSLRPLPCSILSSMRFESMSETLSATTSEMRSPAPYSLQQTNDLFLAQHRGYFARLAHKRQVSSHICVTVKKKRSAATDPLMVGGRTPVCV